MTRRKEQGELSGITFGACRVEECSHVGKGSPTIHASARFAANESRLGAFAAAMASASGAAIEHEGLHATGELGDNFWGEV